MIKFRCHYSDGPDLTSQTTQPGGHTGPGAGLMLVFIMVVTRGLEPSPETLTYRMSLRQKICRNLLLQFLFQESSQKLSFPTIECGDEFRGKTLVIH